MCCSTTKHMKLKREKMLFIFPCTKNKAALRPVLTIRTSLMRKIHLSVYPKGKEAKGFWFRDIN